MEKPAKLWLGRGLLFFVVLIISVVYFYISSPGLREVIRPHHCLFNQATSLLCPACGGTRAMIHLFSGSFLLALKSNALAVITLPLIIYSALTASRLAFDQRFTPADIRIAPVWIWSYFVIVILFWVIRNIPCFAFLRPQ